LESENVESENTDEAEETTPNSNRGFSILPVAESGTLPEPDPQLLEQPAAAEPLPVETTDSGHNHLDAAKSEEISRQADEILARLKKAQNPVVEDQENEILADIREQQELVTAAKVDSAPDDDSTPPSSFQISTPTIHQDDSEMLVVTDSPISSGRATRMNYEQLFDRLRNLPDEKNE